MVRFRNESFARLVEGTLKKAAAALQSAEVPFCLAGSLSAWVRGGPESSHDLDFAIREQDLLRAADALEAVGMQIEVPPEEWLIKAWDGTPGDGTLVDLIYDPAGVPITDAVLERAHVMDVLAQAMPVLDPTDLMVMKLLSLHEQNLDFTSAISTARAIREQIEWEQLRERTDHSPYAEAFFVMARRLGLMPQIGDPTPAQAQRLIAEPGRSSQRVSARRLELMRRLDGPQLDHPTGSDLLSG
jgi:hypothetical protein